MKTDDERSCGSCEWFADEDAWGLGFCAANGELTLCSLRCLEWKRRKGDEKEEQQ